MDRESGTQAAPASQGHYRSEPGLIPPHFQITNLGATEQEGYVLTTPSLLPTIRGISASQAIAAGKGQAGLMISAIRGDPVYFQPTGQLATNLQVQQYRGEPVLTYWQGAIEGGIGYGEGRLLNHAYETVAVVRAANGLMADLHELTLTSKGTALITAYRATKTDLSAIGGPKSGPVQESVVQEVDIATGRLLFEWNSLEHVPVNETYLPYAKGSFDYFHVNSAALWDEDSLIISARNTWALYRIDRRTGKVIWRMHGKASDFEMGAGTNFEWQHHARHVSNGVLTVFDDGSVPAVESRSRGLLLKVDETARKVSLMRQYEHPAGLLAEFEGSFQLLGNGHAVVGYGGEPYTSEFDSKGNLVLDLRFPTDVQSYRGFRYPWIGKPKTAPKVAFEKDGTGGYAVFVSWNGATEVAAWQVVAGASPTTMAPTAVVPKAGFETAITVRPKGRYLAVEAIDKRGAHLGVSKTLTL